MTIGEAIRKAREKRGYSRERLARAAKIHPMTIVNWERDKQFPNLLPLLDVANALKVSLDELVGRRM